MVSNRQAVFNFIKRYYTDNDTFTSSDIYRVIKHKNGSINHLPTTRQIAYYLAVDLDNVEFLGYVTHERNSKIRLYKKK